MHTSILLNKWTKSAFWRSRAVSGLCLKADIVFCLSCPSSVLLQVDGHESGDRRRVIFDSIESGPAALDKLDKLDDPVTDRCRLLLLLAIELLDRYRWLSSSIERASIGSRMAETVSSHRWTYRWVT